MRALSSPFVAGSRFCFWFCFFSFLFLFWVCVLCMCSSLILPLFGCRHRFHNWTKVIRSMSVQYAYILAHTKKNKRNQHEDKKKHFLYIHSESILFFFWNFLFGVFFSIDVAICEIVSYVCVYVFRYHNLETRTKTRFKWWQSRAPKHRHIHIRQILLSTSRRFGILSFCFDCNQSQPNQSKTKTQWNYKLIVFGETKHSLICFEFLQDEKKTRRRRKAKYDKRHFIFRLRIKIGLQLLPFYNDFVLCLAKRKRETHKKRNHKSEKKWKMAFTALRISSAHFHDGKRKLEKIVCCVRMDAIFSFSFFHPFGLLISPIFSCLFLFLFSFCISNARMCVCVTVYRISRLGK